MSKLRPTSTPDYSGQGLKTLKQRVNQLLAEKTVAKSNGKRAKTTTTLQDLLAGQEEAKRNVEAWFLGPRSENLNFFMELVQEAINNHAYWRRDFHPEDPSPIPPTVELNPGYLEAMDIIRIEFCRLVSDLKKSAPFFSMRYQGHMTWDQTIPGMAGYIAAMLYNQNNVALEASPITTVLEAKVADELCRMLGYRNTDPEPWGHLTCGGSTANIEALWGARNLKFYPLSFRKALTELDPNLAANFEVKLPSGNSVKLAELETWAMLNLPVDEVIALASRVIDDENNNIDAGALNDAISQYSMQNMGFMDFAREFLDGIGSPVIFVPGSKHYSLPKGAAILGVGADNMLSIPLDIHGRMNVDDLKEEIDECLENKRPIIAVVGVLGSTEEGAVDPLADILDLRDQTYHSQNIEFAVHADAAWGGYFAAMLWETLEDIQPKTAGPAPVLPMSSYVTRQYESLGRADTITVDPHKTGYLAYPAGALCYRNMAMRSLIAFEAPYINSDASDIDPKLLLGTYGIEGSKPGAAAAGVYLSHAAIPPTRHGYGKILGRTMYNCEFFHLKLLEASDREPDLDIIPAPHLNLEGALGGCQTEAEAMSLLRQKLFGKTHQELLDNLDGEGLDLLRETGSDLNIITYAFNYNVNGQRNQNLAEVNAFNKLIYDRVGIKPDRDIDTYQVIVSTTDFHKEVYGEVFFNDYKQRLLGLDSASDNSDETSISVLRTVIMDPWITEDLDGRPFVDVVVEELCKVAREVLAQVKANPGLLRQ